jgi:diguanylate cyclase (GGDEF)-like protein
VAVKRRQKGMQQPPTVLVVEPRAEDLERTRLLLEQGGFRVVPVTRFEAAAPLFEAIRPDAVVLAAQPPDYGAVAVARRLRQLGRGAVPLLYLVDMGDAEAYRHCLDMGQCVDIAPRAGAGEELVLRLNAQLRLTSAMRRALVPEEQGSLTVLSDPLTGLYNRAFLLETAALEIRRTERFGGGFSLLVASLEDFRLLRRQEGRGFAERLLVYCSVALNQTVREADLVARVGEDEFAVLLPGTPSEAVQDVVARVSERFSLARFQMGGGRVLKASLVMGTVSYPDRAGTATQLLATAHQDMRRMREERRGGRMLSAVGLM